MTLKCTLRDFKNAPLTKTFIILSFPNIFSSNKLYMKDTSFIQTQIMLEFWFCIQFVLKNWVVELWSKNKSYRNLGSTNRHKIRCCVISKRWQPHRCFPESYQVSGKKSIESGSIPEPAYASNQPPFPERNIPFGLLPVVFYRRQ